MQTYILLWGITGFVTGLFVFYLLVLKNPWAFQLPKLIIEGLGIALLCVIPGPILTLMVAYWYWSGWRNSLPIDDDDKRVYPWQD